MRRIVFLFTITFAFPCCVSAKHSKLPSKKEATEMLAKAEGAGLIARPGGLPIHFVAKVHFIVGKFPTDGTYEVLWAAPDRYRQELNVGAMRESDVILGNKRYVLRNTPSAAYLLDRVEKLTAIPASDRPPIKESVSKIFASKQGAENLICMQMAPPLEHDTRCIDAATGALASDRYEASHPWLHAARVETNFFDFGNSRYPHHIISTVDDETLDVEVEKLDEALHFASDVFVPPRKASKYAWCAPPQSPKQPSMTSLLLDMSVVPRGSTGFHGLYLKVAFDGKVEEIDEIYRDGQWQPLTVKGLNHWSLPVRKCAGNRIEYETVQPIWSFQQPH